ncbi:MlaA family lipoprotein [Novosphingobium huizhouense]|uniref:MlaA family lipoprotein n=1 Tax=Novosphingobium huizhouense TaxID=2866625 RepID=UPI001CD8FFE8|nr:VacJ family lipoprotein [Novosphingobium huizhouense]
MSLTILAAAAALAAAPAPAGPTPAPGTQSPSAAQPPIVVPPIALPGPTGANDTSSADTPSAANARPAGAEGAIGGAAGAQGGAGAGAPDAAPATTPAGDAQGGEIVVAGHGKPPPQDPMQAVNLKSYEVVQKVDDKFVAPMAMGYRKALPSPVRAGLRNFLSNLTEPAIALNFLLQLKPGKAAETVGRFAINSTVGAAGLVDVARRKPFNLPYRRNGLAWTLGYYGVGPGPYLFLPLVGPTTVRDLFGLTIDRALLPLAVGKPLTDPTYVVSSNVIKSLDDRVQTDAELRRMRDADDPYGSYRKAYLAQRQAEIDHLRGRDRKPAPAPAAAVQPAPAAMAPVAPAPAAVAIPAPASAPAPTFVANPVVQPLPDPR